MPGKHVEIEVRFAYCSGISLTRFWGDVGDSVGTVDPRSVRVVGQTTGAQIEADTESIQELSDDVSLLVTARIEFEPSDSTLDDVLETAHHFWADDHPANADSNFQYLDATHVTIKKARWVGDTKWISFSDPDPSYVIEASGETIDVPSPVTVIETPSNAPKRVRSDHPDIDDLQHSRIVVDPDSAYTTGQPFAVWERYDDFRSSGWYSSVIPNPGSSDREYEKLGEDEATAAQRAVSLAEKYDIPLLIRR